VGIDPIGKMILLRKDEVPRMRRRYYGIVLACLAACIALAFPATPVAGSVLIIKGSTLIHGSMDGLITLPDGGVITALEVQVASWGIDYRDDDILVYDTVTRIFSHYLFTPVMTLLEPDQRVATTTGKAGTLYEILEDEPFVVFDADLQTFEVMDRTPGMVGSSSPGDTTAPNTSITDGPTGTITGHDVTFTYTGSDNVSSVSQLVYAHKLDGFDMDWS